ncbi:zinc finger protein 615-like isoform X2 [Pararge aegeria]|uniref:zinc finger protein 615-like isoform X2 n=1 Tax=Pararge aegeria TaxID=116150 RepID=UPI0019D1A2F4|nr:zinc finger protein 615-like isoform X2 [Pararge aegeria]
MSKCRACLKSARNMFIFDEPFTMYFNLLTGLNLQLSTDESQMLCNHCLKTLQQFMDFREKCIAANAVFSNIKQEFLDETEVKQELKTDDDEFNVTFEADDEYKYDNNFTDELVLKSDEDVTKHDSQKFIGKQECDTTEENLPSDTNSKKDIKQPTRKRKRKCAKSAKENLPCATPKDSEKTNIVIYEKSSGKNLPCGLCTKSFEDKIQLKSHFATHKRYNTCCNCEERLEDWQEIIAHRVVHLPRMRVPCHLCPRQFSTSLQMEYHFRNSHHTEGERQSLRCRTCDRKFETPRRLGYHCIETHNSRNKAFYCDYCNKLCRTKSGIKAHILTHIDTKPHACDLCDFSTKMKHQLVSHKIYKHNPEKAYCLRCKRVFVSQAERDKHACKQGDYICPVCGKIFRNKTMVNRHARTHDKNHWYTCDRCPAKFKGRTSLVVHLNKHDGIRKHACEFCPAKFYFPSVLIKHRRTHTGIKPYVCKICQKGFTGNHNLKMHMRVHGKFLINKRETKDEQALLQQQADSFKSNR